MWNTWCEILSDTGKLPNPLGGYKLTSLKLWCLNNLTHKRLCEGCVDWKSIGCPQPHMSLSECWHQHFFKRCNRFSLQGLYSESTSGIQCIKTVYFPRNLTTSQGHHSNTEIRYGFLLRQIKTWSLTVENRGNKDTTVCRTMIQQEFKFHRLSPKLLFCTMLDSPVGLYYGIGICLRTMLFWNFTIPLDTTTDSL